MEWIDDSKACLDTAEILITEVERLTQESIHAEGIDPYLKVKIKNCLENCRSPLDYAANYIFNTYCRKEYTLKEIKKFNIYYPIAYSEVSFEKYIREKYKSLSTKRPDIVLAIRHTQPFSDIHWLKYLTKLTNENKHRNLTKHSKTNTTHISHGQIGGNIFRNITIIGNGTPIKYNETSIDFVNPSPYDQQFNATVSVEYKFEELKLSVIPTLKLIHSGSVRALEKLEKTI